MREEAREKILAGSLEVFGERGFPDASMREIADRAGVSKGLAYHYFDSKEALLVAALRSRLQSLLEATERMAEHDGPAHRLASLTDDLLRQVARRPEVFRLYLELTMQARAGALREAASELRESMEAYLGRVTALFEALGADEPGVDALLFRSALLGVCMRLVVGSEEPDLPALRTRLLELFAVSGTERPVPA